MTSNHFDVIVAGAGIAGITSAAVAASRGARVALVSTGPGTFVFGAGCVEMQELDGATPSLDEAISFFQGLTDMAGCPFLGGLGQTRYLPTILGSFQPVSLAPFYLWNGAPAPSSKFAVVGINGLSSFDADFIAERLANSTQRLANGSTYLARNIALSLEEGTIAGTLQFANRFDRDEKFRHELCTALRPIAARVNVILLPGILGLKSGQKDIRWLEHELDCMICELPTLPPSIPGMRLFNRLEAQLRKLGVEFFTGFPIGELQFEHEEFKALLLETPARPLRLTAEDLVLATGPFSGELLHNVGHGIDALLHQQKSAAQIASNVYAAGAILHNSSARGGNAMAILTGYVSGMLAAGAGVQYAQR